MTRLLARSVFLFLATLLTLSAAAAANLQISPVSIQFRAGQGAAGVSLQNYGDTPLYGQVRVYAWDQRDGQDVLTPATDVVASPPVMEIAARSTQTIRLVRRSGAPAALEQTYRILIDEIPRNDSAGNSTGVAIRLQYSVPAFVMPADDKAAPKLDWSVLRKDGAWILRVRNDGNLHAQLGATALTGTDGKAYELSKGLLGYVLAGKVREWRLAVDARTALGASGTRLAVRANVNTQPLDAGATIVRE
jgi:fimbrial chaperone protein